jgi:hypothetical protein
MGVVRREEAMSINEREFFNHLSYSHCLCHVTKIEQGIIMGVCPMHGGKLLVDGLTVEEHRAKIARQESGEEEKKPLLLRALLFLVVIFFLIVLAFIL